MYSQNKRLKIAFLTAIDPQDKRSWSGIFYYAAQALQKHCGELFYVGPAGSSKEAAPAKKAVYKRVKYLLKKAARKYFIYDYHISVAKKFAQAATQKLAEETFDVIVAPATLTEAAFLDTDIPIVLMEDATFALLHNYYPEYSNLMQRSVRQLHTITARAIERASLLVYSSTWAARSAVEDYRAASEKVYVAPMGANIEQIPSQEKINGKKKSDKCNLLFVGVSWQRKGGEIAFETLLKLEEMGIQANLVVCGCTPPKTFSHPRMRVIPFLDKNDPRQYAELEQIYTDADFFFLPTRNECYGIVFCEANAFGLPVIATDTGGVSEIVRNGENGFLLPPDARGADYAEVIAKIYRDDQHYNDLVRASRAAFDERLNWDAWGMTVNRLVTDMLAHKRSPGGADVLKESNAAV